MNGGEVLITISINCFVIYFLHVLHKRSIANILQRLRKEVNELENLVAAIIEEFENVAERVWSDEPEKPMEEFFKPQVNYEEESAPILNEPFADFLKLTEEEPMEIKEATEKESSEALTVKASEPAEILPVFQPQEITDPKHQNILQLWQAGLAVEEIAKQLGTGRGEVQLILEIYKRS